MFPINNNARGPNVNHNPNSLVRRKEQFIALLNICRDRDLQAWNIFRVNDDNVEALEIPSYLSPTRDDAPKILFGMSLSGAFSERAQALCRRLAEIKFPIPITSGSHSYLAAPQKWADWWMRIFQRNTFSVVAKSKAAGI
jgi:hypothetical protein